MDEQAEYADQGPQLPFTAPAGESYLWMLISHFILFAWIWADYFAIVLILEREEFWHVKIILIEYIVSSFVYIPIYRSYIYIYESKLEAKMDVSVGGLIVNWKLEN